MSFINNIKSYFRGVVTEAKKVVWPTKKEVINHTLVVIVAVIVIMTVFGSFDFGLSKLLEFVIKSQG